MAILRGMPAFTGSIGGLSAYKMRGVDRIILREKGGPTRQQLKQGKQFLNTRLRNEEWKGVSKAVSLLGQALHGVRHLYDHSYSGRLSGVCHSIKEEDTRQPLGRRSLLFSAGGYKLEGFGLNTYHPFDTVLKYPLQYSINAAEGTATVEYADIIPAIHLSNPMKQPYCRLVFVLATVPDIVYDAGRKEYRPVQEPGNGRCLVQTPWQVSKAVIPGQQWQLALADWQRLPGLSLLLAAGVEYGQPQHNGPVQFTKYAGAAKVLKMG